MRNYKYRDMVVISGKLREKRVGMSDIFDSKMIGSITDNAKKTIDYRYIFKANLSEALTAFTNVKKKDKEDMEEAKNVLFAGLKHLENYRNVITEELFAALDTKYERIKEDGLVDICTKAALVFVEGLADDIDYYQDNISDSSIRELIRETKGLIAVLELMIA